MKNVTGFEKQGTQTHKKFGIPPGFVSKFISRPSQRATSAKADCCLYFCSRAFLKAALLRNTETWDFYGNGFLIFIFVNRIEDEISIKCFTANQFVFCCFHSEY